MKVKELISKLQKLEPDMEVIHKDGDYGDIEVLDVKVQDFHVKLDSDGHKEFYSARHWNMVKPNAKVAVIK